MARIILLIQFLLAAIPAAAIELDSLTPAQLARIDARIGSFSRRSEELLHPKVRAVLRKMPDRMRRMLATNQYLRKRHLLEERWAMTDEEIRAYRKTSHYDTMMIDVRRAQEAFARLNPGYRIMSVTEVRSLGAQLRSWNRVRSVPLAAAELRDTCRRLLADSALMAASDEIAYDRFLELFGSYETELLTTVAVPGYSLHGRLRAFDFTIVRGSQLVAGTSTASIPDRWDAPGWTARLREAVVEAGDAFEGPLLEPYEPWHYVYRK